MSNIIDINSYTPLENDKFFFDTNIWLYLYCPTGSYKKEIKKKYDGFLKKALHAKSSIFISSLILSEFFNAWIRLEFNILKDKEPSKYKTFKKDFRGSEAYKKSMGFIKTVVTKQIIKISKKIDDKFESILLDDILSGIEKSDFNDNYYLSMAASEGFKTVTHDADFASSRKSSTKILTANYRLLQLC